MRRFFATSVAVLVSSPLLAGPEGVVRSIGETIEANYIFPETAARCIELLEARLGRDEYGSMDAAALANELTSDLQAVSHDLHFRVSYNPQMATALQRMREEGPGAPDPQQLERMAIGNFGFSKLDLLEGNVGYLNLRGFMGATEARPVAVAAMTFLSNADAIIFDMRQNGGGHPEMVQLLSTFLFSADEPVHLNSLYFRPSDETTEYWTLTDLDGPRMPDVPVYVLTSGRTFSAAEEFTYNLQCLERATIVGETTGGGAHPGSQFPLADGYVMFVPTGRAINPITGTNWEGVGVEPDVTVPADQALDKAHELALGAIAKDAPAWRKQDLEWSLTIMRAASSPLKVDGALLKSYAGKYGQREIRYRDGALEYRRDDGAFRQLIALSDDSFMIEGVDFFQMRFETDDQGRCTSIQGTYRDGRTDASLRTG